MSGHDWKPDDGAFTEAICRRCRLEKRSVTISIPEEGADDYPVISYRLGDLYWSENNMPVNCADVAMRMILAP